jgi:cysteine desulfurase / selenocysteine lyase
MEGRTLATDYRSHFADFEGMAYLNAALQGPMPLAAVREAQGALEWKKRPDRLADTIYFDLPDRIREKISCVIGARPDEIAITTGASAGLASVAAGIDWKPGDEVLVGSGEFPAHFSTWLRYEQAGRLRIRVVEPRGRFITADDYIAQIGPQTRVVSASFVRFDNGAKLDSARVGEACRKVGAALLLDLSQFAGSARMDIREFGADMAVCSGYKWLLGPYGAGFFWIAGEWVERLTLGAVYFMALEGARQLHAMPSANFRPVPGARRWDSPETANFTNLAAFESSLDLLLRIGLDSVAQHVDGLVGELIERLPRNRCVLASPEERCKRGPYVCISALKREETPALYEKVRAAKIHVSLRNNTLRIAPYLYNTSEEISRLIEVLSA